MLYNQQKVKTENTVICPTAIASSMGHVIKSLVSFSLSVCLSVCSCFYTLNFYNSAHHFSPDN